MSAIPPSRSNRSGRSIGLLVTAATLLALFHPAPSVHAAPAPAAEVNAGSDVRWTVSALRGRAFHIRERGVYTALRAGMPLEVDRPVKVGPTSRMDVDMAGDGRLQLGPGAQFVIPPASGEGRTPAAVGPLRVDEGYLKVAVYASLRSDPLSIALGRWTARLTPGDYVFETRNGESTACTLTGSMRLLDDAAKPVASPAPSHCVLLSPDGATPVALTPGDWALVENRRKLLPVVMHVSRGGARDAVPSDPALRSSGVTEPLSKMPRTQRVRVAARAVAPGRVEGMVQRLDRWIAQEQDARAAALVASAVARPPAAGRTAPTAPPAAVPPAPMEPTLSTTAPTTSIAMIEPGATREGHPPAIVEAAPQNQAAGEWIVNVATYASLESAEFEAAKLRAQNLPVRIRTETVQGRSSYRVVVEGLASEQAANAALQTVVSNHGMHKAWVFRKH